MPFRSCVNLSPPPSPTVTRPAENCFRRCLSFLRNGAPERPLSRGSGNSLGANAALLAPSLAPPLLLAPPPLSSISTANELGSHNFEQIPLSPPTPPAPLASPPLSSISTANELGSHDFEQIPFALPPPLSPPTPPAPLASPLLPPQLAEFPGYRGYALQILGGNMDMLMDMGMRIEFLLGGYDTREGHNFLWCIAALITLCREDASVLSGTSGELAKKAFEKFSNKGGFQAAMFTKNYKELLRGIKHSLYPYTNTVLLDFDGPRGFALELLSDCSFFSTDQLRALGDYLETGLPHDVMGRDFVWCVTTLIRLSRDNPSLLEASSLHLSYIVLQKLRDRGGDDA